MSDRIQRILPISSNPPQPITSPYRAAPALGFARCSPGHNPFSSPCHPNWTQGHQQGMEVRPEGSVLGLGAVQQGCEKCGSLRDRWDARGQHHRRQCPALCITAGHSALPPVLIPPNRDKRALGSARIWSFSLFFNKAQTFFWTSLCLSSPQSHPWGDTGMGTPMGS